MQHLQLFTLTKTGVKYTYSTMKVGSSVFKSGVFLTKFELKLLLSLSAQPFCVKVLGKVIAKTLCFMHRCIFIPNYIFNNDA